MGNILVTGGAGFIGSHAVLALMRKKKQVVVIDNFSNAHLSVMDNIKKIIGKKPIVINGDVRDLKLLDKIFTDYPIEAVIHFAGLKAVAESVANPLAYFAINVAGSISLLDIMKKHQIHKFVFSSSATVYGVPQTLPLTEESPVNPINPYGKTKLMIEEVLKNICLADKNWRIASLRYFNPCGADASGFIGENPRSTPNNLMPILLRVAGGEIEKLHIYGDDYDTTDGTGVRDYIHVVDLVAAHLKTLDYLDNSHGFTIFNLGRGHGYSVLDMVKTFEKSIGRNIPLPAIITKRRLGDTPAVWADASLAEKKLSWRAEKNLEDMCKDSWQFYQNNK
ncbi:MAG: UDP-glucose 4-epimerase GalE [Alphaproteobacteria bacterium]